MSGYSSGFLTISLGKAYALTSFRISFADKGISVKENPLIPIEKLDKYLTGINGICNNHLELYDISKKIDFRKVISEYEY